MKRKPWRDERILFDRMRDEEQSYMLEILNHWVDSPTSITFIEHSMDRLYQKYIFEDEVIETIKHGAIIELHIVNNSPRLLFRKQQRCKGQLRQGSRQAQQLPYRQQARKM